MEEEIDKPAVSEEVLHIASQAEETFKNKGCLWDTYFYKVVLAGNVKAIKQVVSFMESNASTETLDWLFQRHAFEEKQHVKKRKSKRLLIMRVLIFLILTLVNILLTPVFYALHLLAVSFLNRKQKRISGNIQLPLAYAAFSQNKEMVLFFLSQELDIDNIDHRGNNIFHYISDLSAVAPSNAILIFCEIVKKIDDLDCVKRLLEQERNSTGLTAVEYAAKFGSPSLLTQILKQPNLMHTTPFSASTDHVTFSKKQEQEQEAPVVNNDHDVSTRVELVDVSMYEEGSITNQSTLLNILSDRDVVNMSRTDLRIYMSAETVGQWLIFKCKQMLPGVLFLQILDVIITCILAYPLSTTFIGKNGATFRAWKLAEDSKAQEQELMAWSKNTSSFLHKEAFHEYEQKARLQLQQGWLMNIWYEDPNKVWHLLNVSSVDHVLTPVPDVPIQEWRVSFSNITDNDMDTLYERVLLMPEFVDNITQLKICRLYPEIRQQFASDLIARKSELFYGLDTPYTSYDKIYDSVYKNFTIEDDGEIFTPGLYLDMIELMSRLCFSLHSVEENNLRESHPDVKFSDLQEHAYDSCYYKLFLNVATKEGACKNTDKLRLLKQLYGWVPKSEYGFTLEHFVIIFSYIYIILDIFERCVFLIKAVVHQTSPWDMVSTAFGQKVPGSYVRKQLNVCSFLAVVVHFHVDQLIHAQEIEIKSRSQNEYYAYENVVTIVFIIAIVIRFLMHIHSLRLLPGIGHFVITTFMMGTNLLHFSAVFGIVVLIFSMLFHILIDDPDCPLEKSTGFVTITGSIFSTFKLTFGHGEMEPFFSSAPVQLTYAMYVIIVGLLLLNLIIAIMSTTATDIMAEPWKKVLWSVEWLDEATSVEYTFSVITLPFRKLRGRCHYFHKKAGFIVKRGADKKYKIYIQCFHCPALEEQNDE